MNPLTNMKNVIKLSEQELHTSNRTSWHDQYRDSAWVFIGGLPYDLSEGDIICIFSQYGEIVNINLIRDKDSGKSKGFCFLCYEDQRSTVLAVDNFNGIKILGRIIRVDHVSNYKVPKQGKKTDEETKKLYNEGCAPTAVSVLAPIMPVKIKSEPDDFRETLADQITPDIKLPERLPIYNIKEEKCETEIKSKSKKPKKEKKKKKKSKHKQQKDTDSSSDESDSDIKKKKRKKHKTASESQGSTSENDEDKKAYVKKERNSPNTSRNKYGSYRDSRRRSRSPHRNRDKI